MIFTWSEWQIKSDKYDYLVQRKVGKNRWGDTTYHRTLESAANELFERRIRVDTVGYVVDAIDAAKTALNTLELAKRIEFIASDIKRGLAI